jgi:peptidylprolyl isomerase
MKVKTIIWVTSLLFLAQSCNLDGVNTETNEDGQNSVVDTNSVIEGGDVDSFGFDKSNMMLPDSVNGAPNKMVLQLNDGLRIEWSKKNENNPIRLNDVVMVNYDARIATGKVYDSNKELGKPVPLKTNIGMMIDGWEIALLKMNIGDVARIMIPASLGYSEFGYEGIVPPNADLIVEIQIISRIEPIVLEEGVKVYRWKTNEAGALPTKNQTITFDYFAYTKGQKGKLYDNSFKDSQPFSFVLENDNVVDGLHQGMKVLRAEEHAFIEIPAALAYGKKGMVDLVPKNTDIVYDVRILSIE